MKKLSREQMKKIMGGNESGAVACETGLSCSCHAHVNSNGSLDSWGTGKCGSDTPPAGTTCKNYCCSGTTTGSWC